MEDLLSLKNKILAVNASGIEIEIRYRIFFLSKKN